MCDFVGAPLNAPQLHPMIDYINSVTGWNVSLYELMKVGERSNTLARLFNNREGFTPDDARSFSPRVRPTIEMAGRDPHTGKPTDAKLAELGIS
jgi:aldehyde:ferredoxin oxidoreductase